MGRPKKNNTLLSMKQVVEQTGIPISHLKIIKKRYPDGFTVNNIYIDKVRQFYSEHKQEIIEEEEQSYEALRKEKLANEILLQELKIEQEKKQAIPLKDMEQFMGDFGIQLSSVLKSKLTKELPPQIIGVKEEEVNKLCKEMYNSLIELLTSNMDKWNEYRTNK